MSGLEKLYSGDLLVVDNAFPQSVYDSIKTMFYGNTCSWDWCEKTATSAPNTLEGYEQSGSFSRICYNHHNPDPQRFMYETGFMMGALDYFLSDFDIKIDHLLRIRVGMILPTAFKNKFHHPHTDYPTDHLTALLYLTTCDAPTRIYNEQLDLNWMKNNGSHSKTSTDFIHECCSGELTTKIDIESVENRLILFDGLYFHSSSVPTDVSRRIAINFNFIPKK